jgi:hypothetical protein
MQTARADLTAEQRKYTRPNIDRTDAIVSGVDGETNDNEFNAAYNEFATLAMIWARSDKTVVGEQKFIRKANGYVLIEKTTDEYIELGSYTNKERIAILKEIETANEIIRKSIETAREGIREDISTYASLTGSDLRYNGDAEWERSRDDASGSVHQGESGGNGITDNQGGESSGRSEIKHQSRKRLNVSAPYTSPTAQNVVTNIE